MSQRDLSYLHDIFNAAKLIMKFTEGVKKDTFDTDPLIQSGVMRQIEIMGEATKRLSFDFRKGHEDVPWKKVAGMRDLLIHAYDHVDLDEVWTAAKVSIPPLVEKIEQLIAEEENR